MKKIIISIAVIVVVAGVVLVFFMRQVPDLSQFEHLKNPQISTYENQKMLVAEAKGDPNIVGPEAFGLLFKIYFKTAGTPKGPKQSPPRARWPLALTSPKTEWIGFYAMPVPNAVAVLPDYDAQPEIKVYLADWEHGEVAEILHFGPYDNEQPTIKRLMDFITEQGYEIIGEHEEEYLKGPTMFSKGNPEKYVTIIRYRVKKSA